MKVLTRDQIRELDAHTIRHEPVASIDLMERAASRCAEWIRDHFGAIRKVFVMAGAGNNGGDGLVVARLLAGAGWHVTVAYPDFVTPSKDFATNLERLNQVGQIQLTPLSAETDIPTVELDILIVDALFGSGLSRKLDAPYTGWIGTLNGLPNIIVSIDIPSGLFTDAPTTGPAIEADFTLSLEVPKKAMLIPENHRFIGEWVVLPIGLDQKHLAEMDADWETLEAGQISALLRSRHKFDHKGVFGHTLLITGGYGKAGAAVLASRSALRAGTGLVTVHVPKELYGILQTAVPEAMVSTDAHDMHFSMTPEISMYSAIGIGSGIGMHADTADGLRTVLQSTSSPLVLDADALNLCGEFPDLIQRVPDNSVLTPHFREFERMFGRSEDHFERLEKLRNAAITHQVVIVLKGAHSAVAVPEGKIYFNTTGNPGMATAGSGDVLTGIITSLLAQGYSPVEAAILGVYLHGLAGDLAAQKNGFEAMVAGDIIEMIGSAYQMLHDHRIVSEPYQP